MLHHNFFLHDFNSLKYKNTFRLLGYFIQSAGRFPSLDWKEKTFFCVIGGMVNCLRHTVTN